MRVNKEFIEETIALQKADGDPVTEFATRYKKCKYDEWNDFEIYTEDNFAKIYDLPIDGVKLKFRYTTLIVNGRHSMK